MFVTGMKDSGEPDLYAKQCSNCEAMIAIQRDPATGKFKAEEVRPS
jgi:hypothetical protein